MLADTFGAPSGCFGAQVLENAPSHVYMQVYLEYISLYTASCCVKAYRLLAPVTSRHSHAVCEQERFVEAISIPDDCGVYNYSGFAISADEHKGSWHSYRYGC